MHYANYRVYIYSLSLCDYICVVSVQYTVSNNVEIDLQKTEATNYDFTNVFINTINFVCLFNEQKLKMAQKIDNLSYCPLNKIVLVSFCLKPELLRF
mgnify:FL=1